MNTINPPRPSASSAVNPSLLAMPCPRCGAHLYFTLQAAHTELTCPRCAAHIPPPHAAAGLAKPLPAAPPVPELPPRTVAPAHAPQTTKPSESSARPAPPPARRKLGSWFPALPAALASVLLLGLAGWWSLRDRPPKELPLAQAPASPETRSAPSAPAQEKAAKTETAPEKTKAPEAAKMAAVPGAAPATPPAPEGRTTGILPVGTAGMAVVQPPEAAKVATAPEAGADHPAEKLILNDTARHPDSGGDDLPAHEKAPAAPKARPGFNLADALDPVRIKAQEAETELGKLEQAAADAKREVDAAQHKYDELKKYLTQIQARGAAPALGTAEERTGRHGRGNSILDAWNQLNALTREALDPQQSADYTRLASDYQNVDLARAHLRQERANQNGNSNSKVNLAGLDGHCQDDWQKLTAYWGRATASLQDTVRTLSAKQTQAQRKAEQQKGELQKGRKGEGEKGKTEEAQ